MMRFLLSFLTILCLGGFSAHAQGTYWGPDTTLPAPVFNSYGEILDYAFEPLDSLLTTSILTNRTGEISNKELFFGRTDTTGPEEETPGGELPEATLMDFYGVYAEMTQSLVPYDRTALSFVQLDSAKTRLMRDSNALPIGLQRFMYNTITDDAIEHGGVYWEGYQVKATTAEVTYDLIVESDVHLLVPLAEAGQMDDAGNIQFIFDDRFWFTNTVDNHPTSIAIDFDNGSGMTYIPFGEPFTVHYTEGGSKRWNYIVDYDNGETLHGVAEFFAKDPDPIYEYPCGGGTAIYDNAVMRDLPYEIIPIEVPQVIANDVTPTGKSMGKLGVYYGCGNTECEIKKPFIFVTGFGPDPFVTPKKQLSDPAAKQLFYNHVNGIYGQEAEGSQDAGGNNGANILYRLRNLGYDVIFVDFVDGVDYLQNHAALIKKAIEEINTRKAQNDSKHENIIIGQSMGGISTRYALTDWEQEFMQPNSSPYKHHHCRMWISWEGEMQGANIPMGMQMTTWYMTNRLPAALVATLAGPTAGLNSIFLNVIAGVSILNETLNTPAAKQLLTYHYTDNKTNFDPVLHKNALHVQLQNELATLGYPNELRRVAISQSSSTAIPPQDVDTNGGDPIMGLKLFNPGYFGTGPNWLSMKQITEKVDNDQLVFSGKFFMYGIPVPGFNPTIIKNYPMAESIAPASYERFYHFSHVVASFLLVGSHAKDNYKAPFVPVTTTFDILENIPPNYGYDASNTLFYRTLDAHDDDDLFGYPHNNSSLTNPKNVTPFDACFASPNNEFHNQNPQHSLRDFLLLECRQDQYGLQNRTITGHSPAYLYNARYEASERILTGRDVTSITPSAEFKIGEYSDVELEAPIVKLEDGTHLMHGSRVLIKSSNPLSAACFTFDNGEYEKDGERDDDDWDVRQEMSNEQDQLMAFPNPHRGEFTLRVPEHLVGGTATVYDMVGREIHTFNLDQVTVRMSTSYLPHIVFIKAINQNHVGTIKIIRQ